MFSSNAHDLGLGIIIGLLKSNIMFKKFYFLDWKWSQDFFKYYYKGRMQFLTFYLLKNKGNTKQINKYKKICVSVPMTLMHLCVPLSRVPKKQSIQNR